MGSRHPFGAEISTGVARLSGDFGADGAWVSRALMGGLEHGHSECFYGGEASMLDESSEKARAWL